MSHRNVCVICIRTQSNQTHVTWLIGNFVLYSLADPSVCPHCNATKEKPQCAGTCVIQVTERRWYSDS